MEHLLRRRAVEHHRALVRSTNSGVSAFVDPVGRVIANSQVFTREELDARLPLLTGHTVYETVGDQWAWLFVALSAYLAFGRARAKRDAPAPTPWCCWAKQTRRCP